MQTHGNLVEIFWQAWPSFSIRRVCLWTHDKDGDTSEFMKGATRGVGRGMDRRKFKGNYLRLMSGLCLEDRTNW